MTSSWCNGHLMCNRSNCLRFAIRIKSSVYMGGSLCEIYWVTHGCNINVTWLRHQMEAFSAFLAICAANSPVPGEFPAQRPVTRSFNVFFDQYLYKWLSKQSWGWWFETLSRPLWRHSYEVLFQIIFWYYQPAVACASFKWGIVGVPFHILATILPELLFSLFFCGYSWILTQSDLVTPYGDRDLGQHCLGKWQVAWRHQAIN